MESQKGKVNLPHHIHPMIAHMLEGFRKNFLKEGHSENKNTHAAP
jgi:hypothetical protein